MLSCNFRCDKIHNNDFCKSDLSNPLVAITTPPNSFITLAPDNSKVEHLTHNPKILLVQTTMEFFLSQSFNFPLTRDDVTEVTSSPAYFAVKLSWFVCHCQSLPLDQGVTILTKLHYIINIVAQSLSVTSIRPQITVT